MYKIPCSLAGSEFSRIVGLHLVGCVRKAQIELQATWSILNYPT
jgi:hypothetical protein